jgi:hypothetical protein
MRQLQLDSDTMSAEFHSDWPRQQHAWPKVVQQVQVFVCVQLFLCVLQLRLV